MTAAGRPAPVRRRVRLARGPVTIGEPAAAIEARLAAAEPYRPDTIADGGSAFGLTVRAASVRGLYKRYTGGPRQDDICLRLHADSGTLIAAVADGVSGAPRSDLGAALAVRYATAAVARFLDSGSGSMDWAAVFEHAAWALVEEHRRASGDGDAGVEEATSGAGNDLAGRGGLRVGCGGGRGRRLAGVRARRQGLRCARGRTGTLRRVGRRWGGRAPALGRRRASRKLFARRRRRAAAVHRRVGDAARGRDRRGRSHAWRASSRARPTSSISRGCSTSAAAPTTTIAA